MRTQHPHTSSFIHCRHRQTRMSGAFMSVFIKSLITSHASILALGRQQWAVYNDVCKIISMASVLYRLLNIKLAIEDGYIYSHVGLLFWAPIPSSECVPKARVRFVAMEAMFCQILFAMTETVVDISYWVPWKREDVVWEPLCSHTPLIECPPGDHNLSDTELIKYNLERQRIAKQRMRGPQPLTPPAL